MTTRFKMLFPCLLVLLLCSGAPSDDKPSAKNAESNKNAESVSKVLDALSAAYNARDPKALSELFTPKGEFIDADENVFQGRAAIAGEFSALFEINLRNSAVITADDIREISPGVLSVDCVATFAAAEGKDAAAEGKETVNVDFTAILAKQADGRWLLARDAHTLSPVAG